MALEIATNFTLTSQAIKDKANTTQKKFENIKEYAQYLGEKYGVGKAGKTIEGIPASINVSPEFLQKVLQDPQKAEWLEENLQAMQSLNTSMFAGTLTNVSYSVDGEGNITMITSGTSDPDGKIARANAKRKEEEKIEKEQLERKRLEKQKTEQELLEKSEQKATNKTDSFQLSFSGNNAKKLQLELANTLQSGISLEIKA